MQLDIQSLLTDVARSVAKEQGWYDDGRLYQLLFVTAVALAGSSILVGLAWTYRSRPWIEAALLGSACICTFAVLRAASFGRLDILGSSAPWSNLSQFLELLDIAIVALAAAGYSRTRRPST
jgi:hypothetical protein